MGRFLWKERISGDKKVWVVGVEGNSRNTNIRLISQVKARKPMVKVFLVVKRQ